MKLLPHDGGQLVEEPEYFGERTFLKAAMARFPQLARDSDVEVGVHLSMAALARLAMGALRSGDIGQARAVVDFLEEVLATPRLHPEIRNAVAVSFLEPSELATFEAGVEFLDSMPPTVRHLLG
jgi:ketopantoate reductase